MKFLFALSRHCLRVAAVLFVLLTGASAQTVIITQVYEGLSNNKYVEITNVGSSSVDLGTAGLKLAIWSVSGDSGNGAATGNPSNSVALSGSLAAGASLILKNSSAALPAYANAAGTANAAVGFNGNDAIGLITGTSTIVDLFGVGINNKDVNYSRNSSSTTASTTFNVSDWTQTTMSDVDGATAGTIHYLGFWPSPASNAPTITGINPAAALGGSNVTLTGTNLASPTSVTFTSAGGTVAASVVSSSATEIVATVPAAAITGPVTVTTADGSATVAFRSLNPLQLPYGPETFETGQGGWFTFSVAGNRDWARVSAGSPSNSFMQVNGFSGDVASNDWVILGPIEVPAGATNLTALFDVQKAFENAGDSEFELRVSTDYSGVGDPSSATWQTVPFTKPASVSSSSTVFSTSGAVTLPASLAGSSSVYVAFHYQPLGTSNTSRWSVDNFEIFSTTLPVLSVTAAAGSVAEGQVIIGTVTLPEALGTDVTVTVTSADSAEILVGDGFTFGTTTEVFIPAGLTTGEFLIQAVTDGVIDGTKDVQITAEATGYEFGQVVLQVTDINFPTPSVVINKSINNDVTDVVELLVVGNGTPGSTVDLRGMILKDYSSDGANDGGGNFTFSTNALWASVTAGTLIVLTDSTTAPEDLDGADYVIRANLTNTTLFAELGGFNVGTTEMVQIKAAGSGAAGSTGAIHSFAFGSTSATQIAAAPTPKVVGALSGSFQVLTSATGTIADLNGSGVSLLSSAPVTGIPHNAGNSAFIASLRGTQSIAVTVSSAGTIVDETAGEQLDAITISLSSVAGADVTVNLSASPSGGISLPASVVIPAGESSVPVSFEPIDDGVIAGNRVVTITASSSGYDNGTGAVTVVDRQFLAPPIVINEISNGGTEAGDAVELLVVGDGLSLVGMILKDFSGNMSGDSGGQFTFTDIPLWQNVAAGTLIVLSTAVDTVEDTDASDGIITVRLVAGANFTSSGSAFDISNTDLVMIKAAESGTSGVDGAFHTFGTGIPGSFFRLANGPKLLGSGANLGAANSTSTLADYDGTDVVLGASLGLANSDENQIYITSLRGSAAPVISGSLTVTGQVGVAVNYQITASGSPTSYGSDPLPAGLTLDTVTGAISGTPEAAVTGATVPISATNASGTGTATLTFNIARGTPTIVTPPTAGDITEGQTLGDSVLSGGVASVPGQFSWTSSATTPPLGTSTYSVTFTPTDTANYDSVTLQVSLNVLSGDYEFSEWSGGQPLTAALLEKFAIGGAASPSGVSQAPVTAVEGPNLTITAIVRTNNSGLTVTGEATGNLAGSWTSTGVTSTTAGVSQVGVPDGTERRKFSVPISGNRTFIRLRAVLTP
ncbi:MAG: lamin tail domain-containing protein [Terrimicrobiaceae bacterium]|nr:lamin tail domain-containing protein [Terrimicrobiaceae bacterium]